MEEQEYQQPRGFTAKKSLGQNFLHAPNIIGAMVHAGDVHHNDVILEVGPGKGALTKALLAAGARVIAVEKDDRAIPFLQDMFKGEIESGQLQLVHGDILEVEIASLSLTANEYTLIANIPYYITGEFIRKFLETPLHPRKIIIMVQREVAKRITDTKESILSLSVKAYGTPKYLVTVPRKLFRPMPNVDSAVLVIDAISKNFFTDAHISESRFFEIVKAGFAHKRKVVLRNLEDTMERNVLEEIWEREGISKTARAEDLPLEMWKKIVGYNQVS